MAPAESPDPYGLADLPARAKKASVAHKRMIAILKHRDPRKLDAELEQLDHEAFDVAHGGYDCTRCANCCKTTPPLLTRTDADRIARHLRMRPTEFSERYLRTDADGDSVMAATPCPFLGTDNLCGIYDVRPAACRDYPHTAERRQLQLMPLHLKNASICPAVFQILERMTAVSPTKTQ